MYREGIDTHCLVSGAQLMKVEVNLKGGKAQPRGDKSAHCLEELPTKSYLSHKAVFIG